MGLKLCDKCSEMVDEAKAFCPGCGHAFVEEAKRQEVSNFDTFEGTLKLGDSMYNEMLSAMGLNISKAPVTGIKQPAAPSPAQDEVIEPVRTEAIVSVPTAVEPRKIIPDRPKSTENGKAQWFVWGGAGLVALFLFVLVAAVV